MPGLGRTASALNGIQLKDMHARWERFTLYIPLVSCIW
jgi:hypothetical protein